MSNNPLVVKKISLESYNKACELGFTVIIGGGGKRMKKYIVVSSSGAVYVEAFDLSELEELRHNLNGSRVIDPITLCYLTKTGEWENL